MVVKKNKAICTLLCILTMTTVFTFTIFAEETADVKKGVAVIDGVIDEIWSKADELPISKINPDPGADTGTTGYAKVMWNDQDLYVLIVVNDANSVNPSNGGSSSSTDAIEVYFDIQNRKGDSYSEDGEFYFGIFAGDEIDYVNFSEGIALTDIDVVECKSVVTGNQIVYEIKCPLEDLSNNAVSVAAGHKLGFEVQINDDTDGTAPREAAYNWSDGENQAWERTSALGTLTLADTEVMPAAEPVEPASADIPEEQPVSEAAPEEPVAIAPVTSAPATNDGNGLLIFVLLAVACTGVVLRAKSQKR